MGWWEQPELQWQPCGWGGEHHSSGQERTREDKMELFAELGTALLRTKPCLPPLVSWRLLSTITNSSHSPREGLASGCPHKVTANLEAFQSPRKFSAHLSSCPPLMGPSLMSGQNDCHLSAPLDYKLHRGWEPTVTAMSPMPREVPHTLKTCWMKRLFSIYIKIRARFWDLSRGTQTDWISKTWMLGERDVYCFGG